MADLDAFVESGLLDQSTLESLSQEELDVLVKMINEVNSTGVSDTMSNLWYQDYEEIPVDIDTFIDDPEYLGDSLGSTIYPFWREQLRKVFAPDAKYYEFVLTGGIGLGKSTIADIGMAYLLHKCLCLRNPQEYYGLTKSSIMTFNFFNVSVELSYGVAYAKMQAMLLNSPWFLRHGSVVGVKNFTYVPGKNIQFKIGSQVEHSLGQDVFCVTGDTIIDTVEFGKVPIGNVVGRPFRVFQLNDEGDLVMSNPCTSMVTARVKELIELKTDNGMTLQCTPDHRLMMSDGTYKMVKDINVNDELKEVSNL